MDFYFQLHTLQPYLHNQIFTLIAIYPSFNFNMTKLKAMLTCLLKLDEAHVSLVAAVQRPGVHRHVGQARVAQERDTRQDAADAEVTLRAEIFMNQRSATRSNRVRRGRKCPVSDRTNLTFGQ